MRHVSTTIQPRSEDLLASLQRQFPKLRVVYKDRDAFSRLLDLLLRVVTAGAQSAYMTSYVTTIGSTIYVPADWDARPDLERYLTLRHEAVHLRQFARYGRVGMALLYLVPIFPIGLALGRARLEWEAYRETLRAIAEVSGLEAARAPAVHDRIVRQFTSGAYGWMWPFPRTVRRWIARALEELHVEIAASRGVESGASS